MDMAALSNAFARSNLMEAQASGQLPPRQDLGGKRSSRDYSQMESQASDLRRQYDAFSSQASSQLQVHLALHLRLAASDTGHGTHTVFCQPAAGMLVLASHGYIQDNDCLWILQAL